MRMTTSFSSVLIIMFVVSFPSSLTWATTINADQNAAEQNVANASNETVAPGNTMCPVMPEEEIDPNFFADYQGQRVYLCCRRCKAKFEADPEAYAMNLPVITPVSLQTSPEHESDNSSSDEDHDHAATSEADAEEPHPHGDAEKEHDHSKDHGSSETFQLIPWLGRFHMLIIHFPIALLSLGAFFELISWLGRKPGVESIVRALIAFGAISAVVAVLLGLANALEADYSGTLSWVFWWHRALGIATAVIGVVAWIALERRVKQATPQRVLMARATIFLAAAFVGVTGHFGGSLVYGWEYLLP